MASAEATPKAQLPVPSPIPQVDIKERFYRHFQQECTQLQEQITALEGISLVGGEKQDAVDHVLAGITSLSNEVLDSAGFIPAYDQATYSRAIKALEETLQETRARSKPKARFQFKTRQKNNSAVSINDAAELAAEKRLKAPGSRPGFLSSNESSMVTTPADLLSPPSEAETRDDVSDLPSLPKNYNEDIKGSGGRIRAPSFSEARTVNISGHTGLHIILPSSASRATSSGSLTKLNHCIVDVSVPTATGAPFAGLMLKGIKKSLVIAGHVAGAAHITGVEDSIIVVESRQVRMHDCKNVDIYLHCSSRPIIEDCHNVRFAPIPEFYKSKDQAIANQWDQVDDFKWLKSEHSPNWSILPEEQRLKEDIWTTVVPGAPGTGLSDILRKVGIKEA